MVAVVLPLHPLHVAVTVKLPPYSGCGLSNPFHVRLPDPTCMMLAVKSYDFEVSSEMVSDTLVAPETVPVTEP